MTRRYPGTDIVYRFSVYNNGVLSTPASIAFQYKIGSDGAWTAATPVEQETGVYTATVNPSYGGALFWQWKTTGPNYAEEGMDYITPSRFDNSDWPWGHYDYGWSR